MDVVKGDLHDVLDAIAELTPVAGCGHGIDGRRYRCRVDRCRGHGRAEARDQRRDPDERGDAAGTSTCFLGSCDLLSRPTMIVPLIKLNVRSVAIQENFQQSIRARRRSPFRCHGKSHFKSCRDAGYDPTGWGQAPGGSTPAQGGSGPAPRWPCTAPLRADARGDDERDRRRRRQGPAPGAARPAR